MPLKNHGVFDDTAAFVATRGSRHWSRHEREIFAAACGAAEAAALAVLARDHLARETYRALTAPFANCIALAETRHQD